MKFIIPQNYNFKNKLLGFMDYSTAVFNVIWALFVFLLINIFLAKIKQTIILGMLIKLIINPVRYINNA